MIVKTLEDYEKEKERVFSELKGKVGCVLEFHGYVREYSLKNGKKYEVKSLFISESIIFHLEEVLKKAKERFDILVVIAYHNTGELKIGEKISSIAVFSSHRDEAYQALEFIVSEIKKFH